MPSSLFPEKIEAIILLGGKKSVGYICKCSLLPVSLKCLWYFVHVLFDCMLRKISVGILYMGNMP